MAVGEVRGGMGGDCARVSWAVKWQHDIDGREPKCECYGGWGVVQKEGRGS